MTIQVAVKSPCVGVCEIDEGTQLCRGCSRTAEEIAAWRDSSEELRRDILRRIERRRDRQRNSLSDESRPISCGRR
jgi:hypothetical protein